MYFSVFPLASENDFINNFNKFLLEKICRENLNKELYKDDQLKIKKYLKDKIIKELSIGNIRYFGLNVINNNIQSYNIDN
jgi:hypothetical protein